MTETGVDKTEVMDYTLLSEYLGDLFEIIRYWRVWKSEPCNRLYPTSLTRKDLLVESEALIWNSLSVVVEEKSHSSPVPTNLQGRHLHHSQVGLLRSVMSDVNDCITNLLYNHL